MDVERKIPLERLELFLRLFRQRVSNPSEVRPCVRCWKESELKAEIKALIRAHSHELFESTFPSATTLIKHLENVGWVRPLPIEPLDVVAPKRFFLLDSDGADGSTVEPLELLQAWLPGGVISYFAALSFHGLTTQVPPFLHIGRLLPPALERPASPALQAKPQASTATKERNPLGTEGFRYDGRSYYLTKRDSALVPGVQLRVASPRTWLRITTFEQTLLDTLLQPVRCGGTAVVFEAWENGAGELDADRLASHLTAIDRPELDRRVGAISDVIGFQPSSGALRQRLDEARRKAAASGSAMEEIPLLPGCICSTPASTWRVLLP